MNIGSGLCRAVGLSVLVLFAHAKAAEKETLSPWGSFVEPSFPFFSSVLDARDLGPGWPGNNLTPRGLILNLGRDCWACFDTDLLRLSAMWRGRAVSPVSMSQGSYHVAGKKAPPGQELLPQMDGIPWLTTGVYPGWQVGEKFALEDPREPGPDPKELGRGPMPIRFGRFEAVRLIGEGVALVYEVGGARAIEHLESKVMDGQVAVQRHIRLDGAPRELWLAAGQRPAAAGPELRPGFSASSSGPMPQLLEQSGAGWVVRVPPSSGPVDLRLTFQPGGRVAPWEGVEVPSASGRRWPETIITRSELSKKAEAFVVDNIPLPIANPWRRNVRLADIAFFGDGRAAGVTYDGDVWMIEGLEGDSVRWARFASGFHEPLGLCIRDGEIFVFDRNGIWRVRDIDGNGEADTHELFSNAFAQTAETREFATAIKLAPDGAFIISKGGQQSSTLGKDNGTVLRVAPDGRSARVLGWGLRMPFIGVHPKTGLVTASDQQGNYVPTTPLHIIRDRKFYGFLSPLIPKEQYPAPIADPLTWIPHAVNASGVDQVWLTDARMGPLNDALIHLGYYRPELFLVRLHERTSQPQAAVMSLTRDLAFSPLSAAVNPRDGLLYIAGFQIWGTEAKQTSGLARLRPTGAPCTLPREVVAMDKGILLRFDLPLDPREAQRPDAFSAERWNYRRTPEYGSAHYRLDGGKGQEVMAPSSAYVSRDAKNVFIGIPDMRPVMQMRVGWGLRTSAGLSFARSAYLTVHQLAPFNAAAEGFDPVEVDLTPRLQEREAPAPVTVEEGQRLAELMGCVACHSTDGSTVGKVGPSWKGLFGRERPLADGREVVADEDYLRESIMTPTLKVVKGFDTSDVGMPSYEGVITPAQIEALVLYLRTVK